MAAGEIKSPEPLHGTPAASHRRKRLGMFFLESDDRRTALGGGYTGGATPVNIHGKPLSELSVSKTGGWLAAFFIFGNLTTQVLVFFSWRVEKVEAFVITLSSNFCRE